MVETKMTTTTTMPMPITPLLLFLGPYEYGLLLAIEKKEGKCRDSTEESL
jgi:hypothetical protein